MTDRQETELREFLERHNYTAEQWKASGLTWEELRAIRDDHALRVDDLASAGRTVRDKLEKCPLIHTIKMRVKSPQSVAEKVLRKRLEDSNREVSRGNYRTEFSDLVGVRCLHLFKEQWEGIHAFITTQFVMKEPVVMYHHRGDNVDCADVESRLGVLPRVHGRGYRSIHFVLSVAPLMEPIAVEVQVRTQAEDLWSEVDHRNRYGRSEDPPPHEAQVLDLLNAFTGAADGLVSYVQQMRYLTEQMQSRDVEMKMMIDTITALQKANLGKEKELNGLRESIERMRKVDAPGSFPVLKRPALGESVAELFARTAGVTGAMASMGISGLPRCARCNNIAFGGDVDDGLCTLCRASSNLSTLARPPL